MLNLDMTKTRHMRQLALEAISLANRGEPLQKALDTVLKKYSPERGERRLCADLAYGYFRTALRLEFILVRILRKPRNLPPNMRIILALAAYSLLFQGGAPAYATVDQTVSLVKKLFGHSLAGVANGVLRSIQRMERELENPEWYAKNAKDAWTGNAIFYGIPQTVADLWRAAYGEENALQIMRRSFQRPWTGIRINPRRPGAEALRSRFAQACAENRLEMAGAWGFAFAPGFVPDWLAEGALNELHEKGMVSFQSAGSMLAMENLGLYDWLGPVWDCCAGAGGKSAALQERLVHLSLASDTNPGRLRQLARDFTRLDLPKPGVALADAEVPPMRGWPGQILADAPCSGLGTLARRPDIRNRFANGQLAHKAYPAIQLKILDSAANQLEKGGEAAYITCTLNPAENENVIGTFLSGHPDFEIIREWQTPHSHPWLEGMYGVKLRKNR